MRHILIVAGGKGTRLWPLSRLNTPKQLLSFIGKRTLIQQTYDRAIRLVPAEQVWVVTTKSWQDIIAEQLPEIPVKNILTEPVGKNTAPAICYGTLKIIAEDPKAVIASLPADQHIGKEDKFSKVLESALQAVERLPTYIATIGLKPTEPDTGLGYIKQAELLAKFNRNSAHKIAKFVEKPDMARAKRYVSSGQFLWNGGFFIFQAKTMLDHFRKLEPKTLAGIEKFVTDDDDQYYERLESKPIDTAIMEKITERAVIPADIDWSDVGSWSTLHKVLTGQSKNLSGLLNLRGNHHDVNSRNSLIIAHKRLIATVGIDNLVIVDTEDAVLICNKDKVQEIKTLVDDLKKQGREDLL